MYVRPSEMTARIDSKLRKALEIREVANGDAVKAIVPTVYQGSTYYTPTSTWLDTEVAKHYPNHKPVQPVMTDGDTVRLYFLEDSK